MNRQSAPTPKWARIASLSPARLWTIRSLGMDIARPLTATRTRWKVTCYRLVLDTSLIRTSWIYMLNRVSLISTSPPSSKITAYQFHKPNGIISTCMVFLRALSPVTAIPIWPNIIALRMVLQFGLHMCSNTPTTVPMPCAFAFSKASFFAHTTTGSMGTFQHMWMTSKLLYLSLKDYILKNYMQEGLLDP